MAEYRRLLYVALTRAKDRLILSGGEERGASDSWWCLLDARLEADRRLRGLVEDLDVETLPPPAEAPGPEEVDEAEQQARVELAWQRVQQVPTLATPELVAVGTGAVQDFIACPRRYHYVHRLGLRTQGVAWETPPRESSLYVEREGWGAPAPSAAERGRALLRRVDFRLATTSAPERRGRLEALVREVGWELDEDGVGEALTTVERFLDTAFAHRLAASPASHLHRALSFVLPLPGAVPVALEGEVDLLWETPAGEARAVLFMPGPRLPEGWRPRRTSWRRRSWPRGAWCARACRWRWASSSSGTTCWSRSSPPWRMASRPGRGGCGTRRASCWRRTCVANGRGGRSPPVNPWRVATWRIAIHGPGAEPPNPMTGRVEAC